MTPETLLGIVVVVLFAVAGFGLLRVADGFTKMMNQDYIEPKMEYEDDN